MFAQSPFHFFNNGSESGTVGVKHFVKGSLQIGRVDRKITDAKIHCSCLSKHRNLSVELEIRVITSFELWNNAYRHVDREKIAARRFAGGETRGNAIEPCSGLDKLIRRRNTHC